MSIGELEIKRMRLGDSRAFKRIFDCYYLPLRSFAYRYVGDDEITDDFVQDVFLKVWEKRREFFVHAALRNFLYTSVKNACLSYLRHEQVKLRNEFHVAAFFSEEDEQNFVLEDEVYALLYEAIKDLTEHARRVVLLTMEGKSNPEIASMLQISVNTVKTLKLRAYRVLRERLKGIQWILLLLFF